MNHDLNELRDKIKQFNLERDWDQFHNPKDLLVALMSEVGELAECYRWLNDEELSEIHFDPEKKKKVEEELADIFSYLLMLSYKTDIDLFNALEEKMRKNAERYPIEKAKGKHTNPIKGIKAK